MSGREDDHRGQAASDVLRIGPQLGPGEHPCSSSAGEPSVERRLRVDRWWDVCRATGDAWGEAISECCDAVALRSVIRMRGYWSCTAMSRGPGFVRRGQGSPGPLPALALNLGLPHHPGGNPGANLMPFSHKCHPIPAACVWDLIEETINLPLGCLQGDRVG